MVTGLMADQNLELQGELSFAKWRVIESEQPLMPDTYLGKDNTE